MRRLTLWKSTPLALSAVGLLAGCQSASPVDPVTTSEATQTRAGVSPQPETSSFPLGMVIASYGPAVLSEYDAGYGKFYILRVTGPASDMGYQYGRLVGDRIVDTWTALMTYMGEEMGGLTAQQAERTLGPLLDRAYKHMEPYIPQTFRDEMDGIFRGATDANVVYSSAGGGDLSTVLKRIIALTNTSDLNAFNEGSQAVMKILATGTSAELDAFYQSQIGGKGALGRPSEESQGKMLGRTCSYFAAWGPKTEGGKLFASRNLDWSPDTGIQEHALITVYQPDDGFAHATVGYAGLIGALAGINENGIVVSEVGSNSVLERLKGEPWTLKFREILAQSDSLDTALPIMTNEGAGNRPNTLGYNFLVADGDADAAGASPKAAVLETNGGVASLFLRDAACNDSATLYTYDRDGRIARKDTAGTSTQVNSEASAKEIDADGNVRKFKVVNGSYVRDTEGYLIEDPYGQPLQVGTPIGCTAYRGDEAMGYGTRRWQTAANGPSGDDPKEVMFDSGSYEKRYSVMHGIINALQEGTAYTDPDGQTWVEAGSTMRPIGPEESITLSRAAAMDVNVMNVVYDATGLKLWVAYEGGTGDSWTRAADNPYAEVDVAALFDWE